MKQPDDWKTLSPEQLRTWNVLRTVKTQFILAVAAGIAFSLLLVFAWFTRNNEIAASVALGGSAMVAFALRRVYAFFFPKRCVNADGSHSYPYEPSPIERVTGTKQKSEASGSE